MSALVTGARRGGGAIGRRLTSFVTAVTAVATKELRGRMRGRRAFVVVTVYLLLLSAFAFAIYTYLRQSAALGVATDPIFGIPRAPDMPGFVTGDAGLSASIGHSLFSGLLMIETLLVLVLAPAFTSGAISLEREKQTLDLLVTTPLSTLGMVVGKLISALSYVFLLIVASIPLASLVFVFGGVGPEDLVRGYVILFALAFGMGAVGLLISALVRRTQTATVLTYVLVLGLSIGTAGLHQFLVVATRPAPSGSIIVTQRHQAPEAMLWLNPFVADLDLVCATAPGAYHETCAYMSLVTGRPYFGSSSPSVGGPEGGVDMPACPPGGNCAPVGDGFDDIRTEPATTISFGFPRDTFWPKSALAFTVVGLLATLLSAQLVAPTRRLRFQRPLRRAAVAPGANASLTTEPGPAGSTDDPPTEKSHDEP